MKPLEEGLEGMIERGSLPGENTPTGAYLVANPKARAEVVEMMELSRMIRENFRLSAEEQEAAEPSAGFYARVMARIEAETQNSVWSFLFEPFGRRIIYASMALGIVLLAAAMLAPMPEADEAVVAQQAMEMQVEPGDETVAPAMSETVLSGAVLASDGERFGLPAVESQNAAVNRGTMLMQLRTYEQ
jgi:hypothetical protein